MNLHEFREMCEKHDLTYSYSDDISWWRRGCKSHDAIKSAAAKIDKPAVTAAIWNDVVQVKIIPGSDKHFLQGAARTEKTFVLVPDQEQGE